MINTIALSILISATLPGPQKSTSNVVISAARVSSPSPDPQEIPIDIIIKILALKAQEEEKVREKLRKDAVKERKKQRTRYLRMLKSRYLRAKRLNKQAAARESFGYWLQDRAAERIHFYQHGAHPHR